MIAVIIACEIGFWVLLLAGLLTRYVLRRPGLGAALLIAVPLVDVLLLAVSAIDLRGGERRGSLMASPRSTWAFPWCSATR